MSKMEETLHGMVEVQRQQIAYERSSQSPTVAFFHGIPTSRYLWRNVVKGLSAANIGWIAFDLLGFGESSKPQNVDLGVNSQAVFLGTALSQIGWSGGTIVGHDIGGGVSQLLALNPAVMVEQLVLVDTIAYDSFPEPGIARLKDPAWDNILGDPEFDLKKGFEKGLRKGMVNADRVTPTLVSAYAAPFSGVAGRLAYLRAARALRSEDLTSRTPEIEHLKIPVLLIWGSDDTFQPIRYGQRLADALRDSQLQVIEGAGHFLPEDAPETVASAIVQFVTKAQRS
jgi:2-hydroxymuconate-semialdehyde hydrolase